MVEENFFCEKFIMNLSKKKSGGGDFWVTKYLSIRLVKLKLSQPRSQEISASLKIPTKSPQANVTSIAFCGESSFSLILAVSVSYTHTRLFNREF
jgi:hypothetical protein